MEEKITALVKSLYNTGYAVCKDFFSSEQIAELLPLLQKNESRMKSAGIGKEADYVRLKEIRSDKILWLEKGENVQLDTLFFNAVDQLTQALNRRCFLGLNAFEFHFAKYEPDTFYKRHKDVFTSDDARKVSLILYLNQNWKKEDGGELNIYTLENIIHVEPHAGTLVLFESHIEHEVMLSHANRYSITGWLKSEKFVL